MRKLFGVLTVVAIFVIGLGFYRGWFTMSSSSPEKDADKVNINVTIDRDKMDDDAKAVKKKSTEIADKATEAAHSLGDETKVKVKPIDP